MCLIRARSLFEGRVPTLVFEFRGPDQLDHLVDVVRGLGQLLEHASVAHDVVD